jgi:NACHT domain
MQRTVPFSDVVEALGALDTAPLEKSEHWEFYKVRYQTPAGSLVANYLSLAYDCPLQEASQKNLNRWRDLAGPTSSYTAIITANSPLGADVAKITKLFRARSTTTSRDLLYQNVLSVFMPRLGLSNPGEYFIEPDIALVGGQTRPALPYIVSDLLAARSFGPDQVCADVLVAPAGLGKTTLARAIASGISNSRQQRAIPVLVESAQWQNLINLTLPNILNAAILQLIPEAVGLTNQKLFQLLVRERLLIPIFDGFDELCLHPNSHYNPTTLITELLELVGDTGARIFITTRETFWETYGIGNAGGKIRRINLQGFSNDQRMRFFKKRLKSTEERDIANRVAREVGERIYENEVGRKELQAERASGVPLLLELVALYVDGNPSATFAPASRDPLGPLLERMCERENVRQQLNISAESQMQIFEELFRDSSDDISRSDLAFYVQYTEPDVTKDILLRFESHAFFSPGNDVRARFESLKVYFIARWLANRLENAIEKASTESSITELLEKSASGDTDVFDFLVDRFLSMERTTARAAITHALQMTRPRPRSDGAISALFHLAQRLAHRGDNTKIGRTSQLFEFLGIANPVGHISIFGQISSLDLSGIKFTNSFFKDSEFYNCTFSDSTVFETCRFEGELAFVNCKLAGSVSLINCELSENAEREWDRQAGRASKSIISEKSAREALRDILRRFIGPFGFSTIKDADKNSGVIKRNPCGETAWEELLKAKIIDRHPISGVPGGGLHVLETAEVRHEVRSFLDNAALGPRLQRIIESILKHG